MITVNFNTYASYVTDSLYQWDINQVLSVSGLNLSVAPEVHFANANMDKAIVKQAELINHVVKVQIPNSLLQEPLTIKAYIGIYEADTFKIIETVSIPVKPKARPKDYRIENTDEEIYSFEALKNAIANMVKSSDFETDKTMIQARIDNIIAHNNDTNGNTELVDMRLDIDGKTHASAGEAVRSQFDKIDSDLINLLFSYSYAKGLSPNYDIKRCNFLKDSKLIFDVSGAECHILARYTDGTSVVLVYNAVNGNRYEITLKNDIEALGLFIINSAENLDTSKVTVVGLYLNDIYSDITYCKEKVTDLDTVLKNKELNYGKVLFMGDSITANNSWIPTFSKLLGITEYVNIAVGNCVWRDREETVYDGNPVYNQRDNNVIGNQVEKIIRGKDNTDPNYSKVEAYDNFDMIIISCGTNDLSYEDVSTIESQFIIDKQVVPLNNVDRKTFAGAMRYCYEKLHNLYPKAQIFFCTPIQENYSGESYESIKNKGILIKAISERLSVDCIDTFKCGICDIFNTPGANGEDLMDGLHPNSNGAVKIARYNAKKVSEKRWITN